MSSNGNSKTNLSKRAKTQLRIGGRFAKASDMPKPATKKSLRRAKSLTKGLPSGLDTRKPMVNFIGILVDASGSMDPHRAQAEQVVNAQLDTIAERINTLRQPTQVEIVVFNDTQLRMPVPSTFGGFRFRYPTGFRGGTALWNSIEYTVNALEGLGSSYPDDLYDKSFLLYVVSDGEELHSTVNPPYRDTNFISTFLRKKLASDQWIFGFLTPPGGKQTYQGFGINVGNITEWEPTKAGFVHLISSLNQGTSNYYASRKMGIRSSQMNSSVANLFAVDLEKQKPTLDAFTWNDLENGFKALKVEKEQDIKSFVEDKVGSFQEGLAYYQLTKKELVQSYKDMVVQDKDTNKILSGASAKSAIGMPLGKDFKVEPHNLSKYKLFVQSTSNNRKLVRGTEVLVRK